MVVFVAGDVVGASHLRAPRRLIVQTRIGVDGRRW